MSSHPALRRRFYSLEQNEPGCSTTINGQPVDALHVFDSKAERDAFRALEAGRHAVSAAEARQLSDEPYGVALERCCSETADTASLPASCVTAPRMRLNREASSAGPLLRPHTAPPEGNQGPTLERKNPCHT